MTLLLGLVLAGLSALVTQVGFLLRHRGAVEAPASTCAGRSGAPRGCSGRGGGRSATRWRSSPTPATWARWRSPRCRWSRRCSPAAWWCSRWSPSASSASSSSGASGWACCSPPTGLALLAITGDARSGQDSADYSVAAMLIFEAALAALGVVLILSCRSERRQEHTGIVLGVAAGLLFTSTHVAVKALTGKIDTTVAEVLLSPYLYVAMLGGVAAFFASARSLQIGPAVPVIAVTAIAGNASAIPAGIVVFGDPLGTHALEIGVRMLAFLLVIGAAALIPAPVRAAGARRRCGGTARRRSRRRSPRAPGCPSRARPRARARSPRPRPCPPRFPRARAGRRGARGPGARAVRLMRVRVPRAER